MWTNFHGCECSSAHSFLYCPFLASNVVGSFTLNLSESSTSILSRAMKMEEETREESSQNATAFTQVSHLFKAALISLPVSAYQPHDANPSKELLELVLLHNNCCCFFHHSTPYFFPLSLRVLDVKASNTSKWKREDFGREWQTKQQQLVNYARVKGSKSRMFLG